MVPNYANPSDAYTETAVYTVRETQQQVVCDLILEYVNRWQRFLPGFISANVYLSEDRTHILFQVEWRTREDWRNTLQHTERAAMLSSIQALSGTVPVDIQAYKAPQIIQGPLPETGFVIPQWKDEETTPVSIVAPAERKTVLLTGAQTNNVISLIGFTNAPGDFNILHVHTREDEIWHVIDGEFEFEVGGKVVHAGPGGTVFGPRHISHRFRYAGESGVGHVLVICTPAGLERFFMQLDEYDAPRCQVKNVPVSKRILLS